MKIEPLEALRAASRSAPAPRPQTLLIAGAGGVLGNEVVRRLAGSAAYPLALVLAREPIRPGLRGVEPVLVEGDEPAAWRLLPAKSGIVLFDPPRLFYDRERALWTPQPSQLAEVARWMHASGVRTLAVVMPHDQGRLPEALKRGLASVDEHVVAAIGFERVLILRTPRKPQAPTNRGLPARLAAFMLSAFKYMIPSSEQPMRAAKVAEFLALSLQLAPPGIHIAAPETVWRAAQGEMESACRAWLGV